MGILETLDKAFDYRGDVTIELKNGSVIEGYIFNRDHQKEIVQIFVGSDPLPKQLAYSEIAEIRFTGEDTAAGKSWEEWTKKKHASKKPSA